MATSKLRISVPISPEIALAIEVEAKKIGVSQSTYCAFIIGQHLLAQSKVYGMLNETLSLALDKSKDELNLSTLPETDED
jgi:hypothetical protein